MNKCATLFLFLLLVVNSPTKAAQRGSDFFVEGYAEKISYQPGDTVHLHVSTSEPTYQIQIERITGNSEQVFEVKEVKGTYHPIPENASSKGCRWPSGFSFQIPPEWKSGYYHVTFRTSDGGEKYIHRNRRTAEGSCYFVVRSKNPGKDTKILFQLSTNTYNAYNNWGGTSLYGYHGRGGVQGHEVSFLRPPRSLFNQWEIHFANWAETNGISVDYATNMDLQLRPELLSHYQLVLSVGHDEYWSWEMRDTAEEFIREGGNFCFFSGNTCCWQVRWQEETRSLLCWKQWFNQDPVYKTSEEKFLTSLWSHHLVGRPENELTGVGFLHGGYHRSHGQFMDGSGAFTVHKPEHWIFEGTDLTTGSEFGGAHSIVGYECDGCELVWGADGIPQPTYKDGTPKSFCVLATSPAKWAPGDSLWYEKWPGKNHSGHAVMGLWKSEGGGTVFTAGTTDWAHGLQGGDEVVETITRNLIEKLGK